MNNTLVIVEGPDGAGKSTLINDLKDWFEAGGKPFEFTHHGAYKGEYQIWKHYFDSMLPAFAAESNVILDRSWIAEPIYGQVHRDGLNRVADWQRRILMHVASSCRVSVIWCLPPLSKCLQAYRSRREREMLDNERQLEQVFWLYQQCIPKINLPGMTYDWTVNKSTEVFKYVSRSTA